MESDGIIHINPTFAEEKRKAFKYDVKPMYGKENRSKLSVPTPKTSLSSQKLESIFKKRKTPMKKTMDEKLRKDLEDTSLDDHVVMQIVRVIMAQQYSMKKGIKLFEDKG